MLQNIDIKNFRCFEDTQISGFERVNLIGGKNNSGKTTLLEAIAICKNPYFSTFNTLQNIRHESLEVFSANPEKTWENLFFSQNKSEDITLVRKDENNLVLEIGINIIKSLPSNLLEHDEYKRELLNFKANEPIISLLQCQEKEGERTKVSFLIATSKGIFSLDINNKVGVPFLPSFTHIFNKTLAEEYDRARLEDREEEVLQAFQILDPSIVQLDSFSIGEPTLYLRKKNKKWLPISLFGDAVNRVAAIILMLISRQDDFLLIDEIENGIHYTNQRDFWKMLFRLAIELDTQIFATTHSWEMIRAFADVGVEHYPNMGAYFELAQKPNSDRIVGIKRDLETLEYAIAHGKNIRGE